MTQGELYKRLAPPTETNGASRELVIERVARSNYAKNTLNTAKAEYHGFEKEIEHLLSFEQNKGDKSLRYALLTLQGLNQKWFGDSI